MMLLAVAGTCTIPRKMAERERQQTHRITDYAELVQRTSESESLAMLQPRNSLSGASTTSLARVSTGTCADPTVTTVTLLSAHSEKGAQCS